MFARAVSIVLITALIACPMWCGNSVCHAGQCCSVETSSHQACPVHGTAHCCWDEGSSDGNDDRPCDAPCKSSCQGVCGGAVFEKPYELNDGMDSSLLLLIAADLSVACQFTKCRAHDGNHCLHGGGNHGRSLRTLHMSFLC